MELGVSALTRRERLERIASAERDRRAGRVELAIAVLGEGREWPARVVLALTRLAADEGEEARAILELSLDDWAEESGLDSLDAPLAAIPADAGSAISEDASEDIAAEIGVDVEDEASGPVLELADAVDRGSEDLDTPIEHAELERAFAQAEAQTDEMHDVNRVAERVLMDEPVGLAELVPQADVESALDSSSDADLIEVTAVDAMPSRTDAAWAEAPVWPEPIPIDGYADDSLGEDVEAFDAGIARDGEDPLETSTHEDERDAEEGNPSRGAMLATLERWLVNLEKSRAGRAQ